MQLITTILIVLFSLSTFAKETKAKKHNPHINRASYNKILSEDAVKWTKNKYKATMPSKKELAALKKLAKTRTLANTPSLSGAELEALMSEDMIAFRADVFAIPNDETGPDRIEALLKKYEDKYDSLSPDVQLVVAQMIPVRNFRGILWKMIPLVGGEIEGLTYGGLANNPYRGLHGALLTTTRGLILSSKTVVINPTGEAFINYLSMPYAATHPRNGRKVLSPYYEFGDAGVAKLQADVRNRILEDMIEARNKVAAINVSPTELFVFDNRTILGPNSFPDDIDARYVRFGLIEKAVTVANYDIAISELARQTAFSWQGGLEIGNKIGLEFGFNQFGINASNGVVPAEVVNIVSKAKNHRTQRGWGSQTPQTQELLNKSLEYLESSIDWGRQALVALRNRPQFVANTAINEVAVMPFTQTINMNLDAIDSILRGNATEGCTSGGHEVRSQLTGESACINFANFYKKPPTDLMELMPTEFKGYVKRGNEFKSNGSAPRFKKVTLRLNGRNGSMVNSEVPYRNFEVGNGSKWNTGEASFYERVFPGLSKLPEEQRAAELKRRIRIVNQAWGVLPMGAALFPFFQ